MKKIKKENNYIYIALAMLGILFVLLGRSYTSYEATRELQVQRDIAKEIIRFHVIANSDSTNDQELKLKVKEKVVSQLQRKLEDAKDINQARKIIHSQLDQIEETALKVMDKNGYTYTAHAYLTKAAFPIKVYGDMVFPAGEYEALRVELGHAEGKNWWCVMFPTLCYVDGTYSVVPDQSKQKLKKVLTKEEYESLLIENKEKVKIDFKILDWWKSVTK
jgi:stage II sporulation protein R